MPRIDDDVLDAVIYLYPDADAAECGERTGGSGVIVNVPFGRFPAWVVPYAVTNSHVIREGKSPVIRCNSLSGGTSILPLKLEDWKHHPDGDDVAVARIKLQRDETARSIPVDWFVTKERIKEYDIGPGDEVILVGRFIGREGRQRNSPSLRSGIISMMADEPVMHPRGYLVDSFFVECKSLPGYSGSPVFMLCPPYTASKKRADTVPTYLLGIDWGHAKNRSPVFDEEGHKTKLTVEENTGMAHVAPAWKIRELLYSEELVKDRKKDEQGIAEEVSRASASMDTATERTDAPFSKADFEAALTKVTRKVESE
ncbi:MAG: S1 family peptidase [Terriglobales bacterium]